MDEFTEVTKERRQEWFREFLSLLTPFEEIRFRRHLRGDGELTPAIREALETFKNNRVAYDLDPKRDERIYPEYP